MPKPQAPEPMDVTWQEELYKHEKDCAMGKLFWIIPVGPLRVPEYRREAGEADTQGGDGETCQRPRKI